jgi:hypothetical protein
MGRPKSPDANTVQLVHPGSIGLPQYRPLHMLCAGASCWCFVMIVPAANTFAARARARSADKGARWVRGSLTRPVPAGGA